MIRGVHHIALSVRDLDRMVAFYRDALGFAFVSETGWPRGSTVVDRIVGLTDSSARQAFLRAGNLFLELFEYATPTPRAQDGDRPVNDHGYTHFCLDVTDIDAEYERLSKAGMRFHCPPPPAFEHVGVRATYGRDPEGNVIELQEVLAPESPVSL